MLSISVQSLQNLNSEIDIDIVFVRLDSRKCFVFWNKLIWFDGPRNYTNNMKEKKKTISIRTVYAHHNSFDSTSSRLSRRMRRLTIYLVECECECSILIMLDFSFKIAMVGHFCL